MKTQQIWFGFNAPFIGGNEAILSTQTDERLIKNDLLQLLLTAPGERIMRPDFGSPIRRFVFDGLINSDIEILKSGIMDAIRNYEPRVTVSNIEIGTNHDDNTLNISIYGSFNLNQNTSSVIAGNQLLLVELKMPTNKLGRNEINGVTKG